MRGDERKPKIGLELEEHMPPLRTALELSAREAGARWRAARLLRVQRSWRAVDVVRGATALARLDAEGLHERCEPFTQPHGLHLHRVALGGTA